MVSISEVLWGLNQIIQIRHLEHSLVHGKHYVLIMIITWASLNGKEWESLNGEGWEYIPHLNPIASYPKDTYGLSSKGHNILKTD